MPFPVALSDASVLGLVAIVGFFVVALAALAVVAMGSAAGWWRRGPPAPIAPRPAAPEALLRAARPAAARPLLRGVEIDVPTKHVDAIVNSLRAAGWRVQETGDVVATDDDEEGLTTLNVDLPQGARSSGSGEEIR